MNTVQNDMREQESDMEGSKRESRQRGIRGADVKRAFVASSSQRTLATRTLNLMIFSLFMNIVGFGGCSLMDASYEFLIVPTVILIIAGWAALRCLMQAYKAFDVPRKRYAVILIALVSGGWGFFWGVVSLVLYVQMKLFS